MINELYGLRQVDLFFLLPQYDPSGWHKISADVIQGVVHDSCKVTRGKGWYWFSRNMGSKNPIDLLIAYYGLDFKAALNVLRSFVGENISSISKPVNKRQRIKTINPFKTIPEFDELPWEKLYKYMVNRRCISLLTVDDLVHRGSIFQTKGIYPNICFINKLHTHWEIVGMHASKRYKQVSDAEDYWAYELGRHRAYICESAIDAISLYELIKDRDATYISIAGSVTRGRIIDRIITEYPEVILGVDNDDAGDKVAGMYPYLQRLKPKTKDFNEDLIKEKGEF